MGRSNYQFRDGVNAPKQKGLSPIWRGIGFIILLILTIGGFWLAGYLMDLNATQPFLPFRVPSNFVIHVYKDFIPPLPGKPVVQAVAALVIDIIAFSVMVVLYSIVNPIRKGPTDVDQPRGRGRRSVSR
jgi:hypothetical protein